MLPLHHRDEDVSPPDSDLSNDNLSLADNLSDESGVPPMMAGAMKVTLSV